MLFFSYKIYQLPDIIINCIQSFKTKIRQLQLSKSELIIKHRFLQRNFQIMSLLRAEDYLYDHPKHVPNIYWSELIKTIDQFEQLLQIEKKQISAFLKEKIQKKIEMVKKFYQYKESIKFVGENLKKDLTFLDKQKFEFFFEGYSKQIKHIIHYVLHNPKTFAGEIVQYKSHKKYNFMDFCQNIPVLIYPYYMPLSSNKTNNCLVFTEHIINLWPYSLEYARPKFHSLIDDIIYGFFKIPPILCYVQKISSKFLKQISNCRMEIFAFDEDAIKNQIDIKKHATVSYTQPQKKSIASKIKNFFKGGKDDNNIITEQTMIKQSMIRMDMDKSESEYSNIPEMMKKRQTSFIELIKNTVQNILNEEPPFLLKKLLQFFKKKLEVELMKQNKSIQIDFKHYCYFLLTNFICAQLHNKFTVAHEQTGMTNADLQNISQIIRIVSSIFQGQDPDLKRYKNVMHSLNDYKFQVSQFYQNFFTTDDQLKQAVNQEEMRQILINYYENNILLTFNDVKICVDIYHEIKCKQTQKVDPRLQFLEKPQISALFDPSKKVKLENTLYLPENVLFLEDWSEKSKKQIIQYFVANQQPLQYLPLLRDVFFFSSNLNVEESLEVAQDLKLIKKMPLKNIKQYLVKTANKFTHLNVKQFYTVQKAFKDSLKNCLRNNLKRKQYILYYRSQILYKLQEQMNFISFFINQLKSQQFYQKMSQSFFINARIKVYLNIENNLFKVSKQMKDLKGLGISNLMLSGGNQKGSTKSSDDYILRHSFKIFQGINQFIRCIGKNQITKSALLAGRKVEEFNQMFCFVIQLILPYTCDFLKKRALLQNLSKQKLQKLVIKKLQDMIYLRHCAAQKPIQDDRKLYKMSELIDKKKFYQHEIQKLNIETQFLVEQGKQKFKLMIQQTNVSTKLAHLDQLFRVLFTIIGFTMSKGKISSDIITPMFQFIILQCADLGHFKCLYSIQCLKYNKLPQIQYEITTYRSALMYIKQNMAMDYQKPGCQQQIKSFLESGINVNATKQKN